MPELIIKSKGKEFVCLFDFEDQELISRFNWSLHSKGYAVTNFRGKQILMHRLILGIIDNSKIEGDHKNHNKLDNQRVNLRICIRSENRKISRKLKEGSSKFKGVYKNGKFYHSQIMQGQRVTNLGRYRSEVTAGKVYDNAAKETFKEFAFLNFPGFKQENQLSIPGL
jgi:hypothetical protein